MERVVDYIISLTNLYGFVHKNRVVQIYNMQHSDKISTKTIDSYLNTAHREMEKNFIEVFGNYFVHETIMEFDEFEFYMEEKKNKPFYVPDKEELLKYKNGLYFEITEEYTRLLDHITLNFYDGDRKKATMLAEDIQGYCEMCFSAEEFMELFEHRGIAFKDAEQLDHLLKLVSETCDNTRIWNHNGFTSKEMRDMNDELVQFAKN
ncbi:hypothetical protein [Alkalibacter mobilis]|uniref:hypothetical protein n=1 Tax=Alkalibacter mobilis TaxID=2787712 RepID=UPI00189EE1BF|nr:hypothetical protein [Alkalibacter mobilis]MBF7095559.1 hypothetical protein [Alkalibacter mobilis]